MVFYCIISRLYSYNARPADSTMTGECLDDAFAILPAVSWQVILMASEGQ
ncbi:MAG: hypothetical protein HY669_02755 [Chloroflexi bacterium]|nr:hypothetical protein [Chloroflexota bacterium]